MAGQILVTVVISTYNHEHFIGRCIESVQLQNVSPMEIIILDDYSSDNTPGVIEDFRCDKRITYVRNPENIGPRLNNTRALEVGSGRYHVWLHGDDYLLPGHLERIIGGLEQRPECSLGYAPPVFVDAAGETLQTPDHPGRSKQDYAGGRNELALLLIHDNYIVPSSVVFRRSELNRVGNFHPSIPGADWDLYTRVAIQNPNFYYTNTLGVGYRFHPGQVSVQFYANTDPLKAHLHVVEQAMYSKAAGRLQGRELEILDYLNRRIQSFGAAAWTQDQDIRRVRGMLARHSSVRTPAAVGRTPTISIVIPCYRQAQYLTDALDSVLAQGFEDWECLVVDDGSPDDTAQVVTRFIKDHGESRIRLITKSNGGLASARNAGAAESRGRYILPLDADDKLHPDYLTETVAVLDRDPETDIVYVDEQNFGLAGHVHVKTQVSLEALKQHNVHDYCSLYRRKVWEQIGGYSPAMYLGGEDWQFWLAASAHGFRSHHLRKPLFLYRNREHTMVSETQAHLGLVRAQLVLHHPGIVGSGEIRAAEDTVKRTPAPLREKLRQALLKHTDNPLLCRFSQLADAGARDAPLELPSLIDPPLVSVIVTTMDRPEFLKDAVDSLVRQTYENWEAIIVNDGGDDIGDWITTADPTGRIHYIRHPQNCGLSAARNTGISLSSGEILCYLDDDDRLFPDHLETIVDAMQTNNTSLVYTEAEYVRELIEDGQRRDLSRTSPYSHIDYSLERLHIGNFIPVNTWAHRRELIAYAGDFDVTLHALEDWDLLLRLARITTPEHIPRITAEVRLRPGTVNDNMSQRARGDLPALHRKIYARYAMPGNHNVDRQRERMLKQLETDPAPTKPAAATQHRYDQWRQRHTLTESQAQYMAERMMLTWQVRPSIQLIVTHQAGQEDALADTLDSLGQQLYKGWGLSVVSPCPCPDDSFNRLPNLEWVEAQGDRIAGINGVVGDSQADWIVQLDAGTRFSPDALFRWVDYINLHPHWQLFYCDEDRVSADGIHHDPLFKPDFNLDLLRSTSYMGDVVPVRRELLARLDGYGRRTGAGVYDMALRVLDAEGESIIGHIPEVLIHCRDRPDPQRDEQTVAENRRLTVEDHLQRNHIRATVGHNLVPGTFFVDYALSESPMVSIIIPYGDQIDPSRLCLSSVLEKTDYPHYEVIVVDDRGSDSVATSEIGMINQSARNVRVVRNPEPGGIPAMLNFAAREAQGVFLLLLDPGTQAIHAEWLARMVAVALRPEVGAVGARLVDLNGRIKQAGLVLGMQDGVGRPFAGADMQAAGYLGRHQVTQNYSALEAGCMLVKRDQFLQLGGLNAQEFKQSYFDADFCLRLQDVGCKLVWTPFATLLHHGTTAVQGQPSPAHSNTLAAELTAFQQRWLTRLASDPAHNPNLSLVEQTMQIEVELAVPWLDRHHPRPRIWAFPLNDQGVGQYRVRQPLDALDRAALAEHALLPPHERVERARVPTVCELARADADTLLIQHGFSDLFLRWLPKYRALDIAFLVFGLDDNLLEIPETNDRRDKLPADLERRIREALSHCHRLIVPTEPLVEVYRRFIDDVRVVPNQLEQWRWQHLRPDRRPMKGSGGKPRVGWVGAQQHRGDLALLAPVMKALHEDVDWVMMGMCPAALRRYVREFHQPVPYSRYPEKLSSLNLDLAVAPLEINVFNECKSDLRILEYGALGWPVVATDIHPYRGKPVTRLSNSATLWIDTIRERINDLEALAAEGRALREWVHQHRFLEHQLMPWFEAMLSDAVLGRFPMTYGNEQNGIPSAVAR